MLFLRMWVEQYPGDFSSPPAKGQLESFLSQQQHDSPTAGELLKLLAAVSEEEPQGQWSKEEEEEKSKEPFTPFSLSPQRFAMALTALESVEF